MSVGLARSKSGAKVALKSYGTHGMKFTVALRTIRGIHRKSFDEKVFDLPVL